MGSVGGGAVRVFRSLCGDGRLCHGADSGVGIRPLRPRLQHLQRRRRVRLPAFPVLRLSRLPAVRELEPLSLQLLHLPGGHLRRPLLLPSESIPRDPGRLHSAARIPAAQVHLQGVALGPAQCAAPDHPGAGCHSRVGAQPDGGAPPINFGRRFGRTARDRRIATAAGRYRHGPTGRATRSPHHGDSTPLHPEHGHGPQLRNAGRCHESAHAVVGWRYGSDADALLREWFGLTSDDAAGRWCFDADHPPLGIGSRAGAYALDRQRFLADALVR